jgi:hypothetical protein
MIQVWANAGFLNHGNYLTATTVNGKLSPGSNNIGTLVFSAWALNLTTRLVRWARDPT